MPETRWKVGTWMNEEITLQNMAVKSYHKSEDQWSEQIIGTWSPKKSWRWNLLRQEGKLSPIVSLYKVFERESIYSQELSDKYTEKLVMIIQPVNKLSTYEPRMLRDIRSLKRNVILSDRLVIGKSHLSIGLAKALEWVVKECENPKKIFLCQHQSLQQDWRKLQWKEEILIENYMDLLSKVDFLSWGKKVAWAPISKKRMTETASAVAKSWTIVKQHFSITCQVTHQNNYIILLTNLSRGASKHIYKFPGNYGKSVAESMRKQQTKI